LIECLCKRTKKTKKHNPKYSSLLYSREKSRIQLYMMKF
jgi:hypothetical protein